MLRWFNRRQVRTHTGAMLLALIGSLWLAMAAQPCLAGELPQAANAAPSMSNCYDAAALFPCNAFANLDCELPERGPFAAALSLPFLVPVLVHTLDIASILVPVGTPDFPPLAQACATASGPPLNLQHCVFLI